MRKIHGSIQDYKHGRDPDNPLRPGEATGNFLAVQQAGLGRVLTTYLCRGPEQTKSKQLLAILCRRAPEPGTRDPDRRPPSQSAEEVKGEEYAKE